MKRVIRYAVIALIVIGLILGGLWYWYNTTYFPSTADAYVGAHSVRVAPRVSGHLVAVPVHDYEHVKKGQLLYQIDPHTFRIAVEQDKVRLKLALQQVAELEAAVVAAKAALEQAQVQAANAERQALRQQRLLQKGATSVQAAQDAEAAAAETQAAVKVAQARLAQAKAALGKPGEANHQVQLDRLALKLAEIRLADTSVKAACSGRLSAMKLRPGDYVVQGQPNFALVCDGAWWVDANYKETMLARIHPGESAKITIDMYGGHVFKGRVISINPASGTAFSLLPPENATGNWVKVTQRVPVRVEILDPSPKYPLRVGTSAEVTIDTLHPSKTDKHP